MDATYVSFAMRRLRSASAGSAKVVGSQSMIVFVTYFLNWESDDGDSGEHTQRVTTLKAVGVVAAGDATWK
jgi:hypothetical protein